MPLELVARAFGALALIAGGALAIVVLGRRARGGTRSLLRVHARVALAKGAGVAVVEVAGRALLVGLGEKGVSLLTELDPGVLEREPAPARPGLLEALAAAAQTVNRSGWKPLGTRGETLDVGSLNALLERSAKDGPRKGPAGRGRMPARSGETFRGAQA